MANAQLNRVLQYLQTFRDTRGFAEATDAQLLEWFVTGREEAAFAALLRRHGPMVWGVARRVLLVEQDAEDVFQAAFLLLARKAGAIRKRESVGSWLHGVAHRLAVKVKAQAVCRKNHERRASDMRTSEARLGAAWQELRTALDAALQELPEKYRSALVFCYLEGKTHAEAAGQLGCPLATLRTRVARGRKLLRDRLMSRGLTLSTAGLSALLLAGTTPAAAPTALVKATLKAALSVAAGQAAALCSAQVATLVEGGLRTMLLGKVKTLTVLLLAAGFLAGAGAATHQLLAAPETPALPQAAAQPPAKDGKLVDPKRGPKAAPAVIKEYKDGITVQGRVLDPDGKPLAGAKLFVFDGQARKAAPQPAADAEGRFRFTLALDPAKQHLRFLQAVAEGYGCDWIPARTSGDWTLHLRAEVPIKGQIVNLEGRPVAGASVRVTSLWEIPRKHADEFLRLWPTDTQNKIRANGLAEKQVYNPDSVDLLPPVTTDANGRFMLRGVGRDTVPVLRVGGPGIAERVFIHASRLLLNSAKEADGRTPPEKMPEVRFVVDPGKAITGLVRDRQTGKPVAGIRVSSPFGQPWVNHQIETVTDAEGRYRLEGLTKQPKYTLTFSPGADGPYLNYQSEATDTDALQPVKVDVGLVQGVLVQGRLTDKATGKPVRGWVYYRPLQINETAARTPGVELYGSAWPETWADADGKYRLTVLPGPGALFVKAGGVFTSWHFTQARLAPEDQDPKVFDKAGGLFLTYGGDLHSPELVNAYRIIRPAAEATDLTVDLRLDSGKRRVGRVLDPEGKPLAGVQVLGLFAQGRREPLASPAFEAVALDPERPRRLLFLHFERKLAGSIVLRGDEVEPVIVKLQPCAAVTGRILDAEGKPVAGVQVIFQLMNERLLSAEYSNLMKSKSKTIQTDTEGRFRVEGIPAGMSIFFGAFDKQRPTYFTHLVKKLTLSPGQIKELGDLRPNDPAGP